MPGLFGVLADDPAVVGALVDQWLRIWPDTQVRRTAGGAIGAHGFQGPTPLQLLENGSTLAVEGDASAYEGISLAKGQVPPEVGRYEGRELVLAPSFRGNAAVLDPGGREVQVSTEWTGTFPIYTWQHGDAFAFSSLQGPLLSLAPHELDPVGLSQYLSHSYTCSGHSFVRSVRRLLPGQHLRFRRGGTVEIQERSTLWSEEPDREASTAETARRIYPLISAAVRRGSSVHETCSLMMSAGWDARLLLAAMHGEMGASRVRTLSHGDTGGRELRLAKAISTAMGSRHVEREITTSVLDHGALATFFERCGSAIFPHWIESAAELERGGSTTIFSGVYGEVLGGHYGETMVTKGAGKALALVNNLYRKAPAANHAANVRHREALPLLLGATPIVTRWYLKDDWVRSFDGLPGRVLDSVNQDIARLERRGVSSQQRLIEAFVSEHRGSQFIGTQALSARTRADVSLPFIDRELLQAALRAPLRARFHNQLNQEMLRQHAPRLLAYPMAATLVSARHSILAQELSRGSRVVLEQVLAGLRKSTGGRVSPWRMGWSNFGFLANPGILAEAVEALTLDIWDRERLLRIVRQVEDGTWGKPLHTLFYQLGNIFTVDHAFRMQVRAQAAGEPAPGGVAWKRPA
ncbi:MAG: hypothetical protein EA350_17705 [Gemmatimonadales bacterium]|nr:MAG: hypothetical protein EA350_17705 [Gemmatimonadales bacterium]